MKKGFIKNLNAGFTLVELMTCCAIIAVLSAVVIYNYKGFNDNLEITNLSYQVALALRQAQVYGVSTKDFKGGGTFGERFSTPYGLHFDKNYPTQYLFFADVNQNHSYDTTDTILETVNIGRGNDIERICPRLGSYWNCFDGPLDVLDINFTRPEPEPIFFTIPTVSGGSSITAAAICLESPQGKDKRVFVYNTGQIAISDGACDSSMNACGSDVTCGGGGGDDE